MIDRELSPDAQVLLLLCSTLGLARGGDLLPLAQNEWNDLAQRLAQSELQGPGALLGFDSASLSRTLALPEMMADRIARLLVRAGQLAVELERLSSMGIWALTRADEAYPEKLAQTLGDKTPNVLFGAGEMELLNRAALAIIGSRDIDEAGAQFALLAGQKAAESGLAVVSGGARGVDRYSMTGALEGGGVVVGVLADSLVETIANRETRQYVMDGRVALVSISHPQARFTVGTAMQRNKVIYGLARYALVVASAKDSGGTWAGATANLKAGWVPLFVRTGANLPEGNAALVSQGGLELAETLLPEIEDLRQWLDEHTSGSRKAVKPKTGRRRRRRAIETATQESLFN